MDSGNFILPVIPCDLSSLTFSPTAACLQAPPHTSTVFTRDSIGTNSGLLNTPISVTTDTFFVLIVADLQKSLLSHLQLPGDPICWCDQDSHSSFPLTPLSLFSYPTVFLYASHQLQKHALPGNPESSHFPKIQKEQWNQEENTYPTKQDQISAPKIT